jgi:hypothetical protein
MMRIALAFIVGALVAAGVAVWVVKKNQPPSPAPQPAAVTTQAPAAAAVPEPPPQAPAQAEPAARRSAPARPAPAKRAEPEPVAVAASTAPLPPEPAPAVQPAPSTPPPPPPSEPAPAVREEPPAPAPAPPPPPIPEPHTVTIPAGTMLNVRLSQGLSSDRNHPGDTFSATLDQPLVVDGFVLAERGARAEGRVVEAEQAGRVKGVSSLSIQLTRLTTSDGQRLSLATATVEKQGEKSTGTDAAKIGAGAAIGAAIGAIAGGGKGAAIGAGTGGAAGTGVVLATRGKPVELKTETRVSFRLTDPVVVTEKLH